MLHGEKGQAVTGERSRYYRRKGKLLQDKGQAITGERSSYYKRKVKLVQEKVQPLYRRKVTLLGKKGHTLFGEMGHAIRADRSCHWGRKAICYTRVMLFGEFIVQELCESRGGRPELSVLTSLLASADVKIY